MHTDYKKLKLACYTTNLSMSIVANLSPVLFLTFRSLYGLSYSLLGLLVLINFSTEQLAMKFGMLVCTLFPLAGIGLYASLWHKTKKERKVKK